jgi:transcriptional regulator with XRE-family HTH domain
MNRSPSDISNLVHENRLKVGKSLRLIREKRGYSQDYLANLMNVSRSTISKIENGKFSVSIDYLSKLSIFLNFDFFLIDDRGN